MKIFTEPHQAKKPKTGESQKIAYAYAIILVVLVLCQLFTFDKFLTLLQSFGLAGGAAFARFIASILVVSEVFALPFLLRLDLSHLMRVVSMVMGWLVPLVWLGLSLWLVFTINAISNIGFLGTVVSLTPGWWAVFISVSLGLMSAWASWGLWPGKSK